MLKNKSKIIAFFLILFVLFTSNFVFAEDTLNDENTAVETQIVAEDNTTNEENNAISEDPEENGEESDEASETQAQDEKYKKSDVYLAGDNVTIDYIVDGNLFVCANTVTINSQIGGDAFIMANKIIVDSEGYVFNNLFAMANSIEIKGVVYDVYALGNDIQINNGYIYRDLNASCGTLNINGTIGRNVFVNCSNLNFGTDENSKATIYGDLNYSSNSESSIPANIVKGNVNYNAISSHDDNNSVQNIIANQIFNLGTFLAFLVIIWLICLWLTPKFLNNTNKYVGKNTLNVLGKGFLTAIAIPVICVILLVLQLTFKVSFVLLGLFILALVISKLLFTIVANNFVCSKLKINKNSGIFGMLILSGIIFWALTKIPYAGGIISFVASLIGLGVLVSSILPKKIKAEEKSTDIKKEAEKIDAENK